MSGDLVAFLRARLDETARKARKAKPGPWHSAGGSEYATHPTDEVVDYARDDGESADHIAENAPARVLREVEAKRELLSRYEAMEADVLVVTGVESILSEYRRVILPGLAAVYSDHADYREH